MPDVQIINGRERQEYVDGGTIHGTLKSGRCTIIAPMTNLGIQVVDGQVEVPLEA